MNNYLTVKQFADAANVSTQRIYQRLTKDLQPFCKTENGKKYLSVAALKLFEKEDLQSTCQGFTKTCQDLATDTDKAYIDSLLQQIEDLKADKDKLNARLDKAEETISNLTAALQAAQALHGIEKKQAVIELTKEEPQQESADDQTEAQQELNFFQRLRNFLIHRG